VTKTFSRIVTPAQASAGDFFPTRPDGVFGQPTGLTGNSALLGKSVCRRAI
jgi:hypothetical protein